MYERGADLPEGSGLWKVPLLHHDGVEVCEDAVDEPFSACARGWEGEVL
jgi:hypothetical protein